MAVAPTMNLNDVGNNNSGGGGGNGNNIDNSTTTDNNNNKQKQHQHQQQQQQQQQDDDDDGHEHDMVMPGFRFHPTEEELVEFYLRRKVEGKKFNIELITFLDLYRYDPWELPALAAIGEKEWFFYVPRDRKYRNGDRPNRVTTSGYWKATGADRMIRAENFRPIGLKKTLVFYSGKAPKGIRTSWIMNEYRLPQHETERYQKAEISLCRVYKRAGVEDHPSLPWGGPLSSRKHGGGTHQQRSHQAAAAMAAAAQTTDQQKNVSETTTDASSSTEVGTALGLSHPHRTHSSSFTVISPAQQQLANSSTLELNMMTSTPPTTTTTNTSTICSSSSNNQLIFPPLSGLFMMNNHNHSHHNPSSSSPLGHAINSQHNPNNTNISSSCIPTIDELQRLVSFQQQQQQQQQQLLPPTHLINHNFPNNNTNNSNLNIVNNNVNNPAGSSLPLFTTLLQQHQPPPPHSASSPSSLLGSLLNPIISPPQPPPGSIQLPHGAAAASVFSDRLWEWSSITQDPTQDFTNPHPNFK